MPNIRSLSSPGTPAPTGEKDRCRVWIHEGPQTTAPATVGRTVAVTNWSLFMLPQRHLEAVLAHELAHHLALPPRVSLSSWLSRHGEQAADRTAADLGYGRPLVEVFAGREFERALSAPGWRPERFGVGDSQPIETRRRRMLEKYLKGVAQSTHQPYRIDSA
jgi:hypothetical protein